MSSVRSDHRYDPTVLDSPLSRHSAHLCISAFMDHAVQMASALKSQNLNHIDKIGRIYNHSIEQIKDLGNKIIRLYGNSADQPNSRKNSTCSDTLVQKELGLNQAHQEEESKDIHILSTEESRKSEEAKKVNDQLSQVEVKSLSKDLKKYEKAIVEIIRNAQVEAVVSLGNVDDEKIKSKVVSLAIGGWSARWVRLLSCVFQTHRTAIEVFERGQKAMEEEGKKEIERREEETVEVEEDRFEEFKNYQRGNGLLDRRAGIINLGSIYRFHNFFDIAKIKTQLRSFIAQNISRIERKMIERKIKLEESEFNSKFIPLNKEFDTHIEKMSLTQTISSTFSSIFGTRGISSANRQERHLVNAWESNLINKAGKTIFRALRHAITSDKYEKDLKIRKKNSENAAKELIKAALLQEIAARGLSLESAASIQDRITLNFTSVSLVTPDGLRPYVPGQADERQMLLDQVLALESLKSLDFIELNGKSIPVNVNVNTFNFGVNALARDFKLGLANQYEYNLKAMEGLRKQYEDYKKKVDDNRILVSNSLIEDEIRLLRENSETLFSDIESLMKSKDAYLAGNNQYEIGAKILNLTHLMDQTMELINKDREPEKTHRGF